MQTAGKPRGLQAARKLRVSRRDNRWADKSYKKRALGNIYKTSPTGGSSHAKGIVLEKVSVQYGIRGHLGLSASKMGREKQEERGNSGRLWEMGIINGDDQRLVHWLGTDKHEPEDDERISIYRFGENATRSSTPTRLNPTMRRIHITSTLCWTSDTSGRQKTRRHASRYSLSHACLTIAYRPRRQDKQAHRY
jgi:hypothetical protein